MNRFAALALLVLAVGCSKSASDTIAPAPSGGLPTAPPGALGASAAQVADAGARSAPLPGHDEPAPDEGDAAPPTLAPPPGSGVAL